MNLSDFFIRGRHLFGFLVPGVMWVSVASILLWSSTPLSFIEEGDNPVVRSIFVLALGYMTGFCLQTVLWPLIINPLKNKLGVSPSLKMLTEYLEGVFEARLPPPEPQDRVTRDRLPLLCKLYVLENSQELRKLLLEKEADINFLVAVMVPGPLLLVTWTWFETRRLPTTLSITAFAVTLVLLLLWNLRRYLLR